MSGHMHHIYFEEYTNVFLCFFFFAPVKHVNQGNHSTAVI